ncbi:MAG: GTP 3',8-cyclase MoaA [Lachnospiraceae bacterium]|nr:GTP 3',8-cyclase MoaA [Lachnospiraceae bacterium]
MKDQYGRKIDYLRISITDRCNLRCTYCMPEEGIVCIGHDQILRYEEIITICRAMAQKGFKHLKITGGEPLVRRGAAGLIRQLKAISGIETVTLTTNGILLEAMIQDLADAGIDGINVSLDTLDAKIYARITRGGNLNQVLAGLKAVLRYPQITLKVNCVLSGEDWEENAISVAELAKDLPIHVRFIEHMPIGPEPNKEVTRQDLVKEVLERAYGTAVLSERPMGYGPSVYYRFEGFSGKIGFISAVSHKFCSECNRVRLTADGRLRLCLQSKESVDLKAVLRGNHPERLGKIIEQAVYRKPREHHFEEQSIETTGMSQIGG